MTTNELFINAANRFVEMTKKYCDLTMNYCNIITSFNTQQNEVEQPDLPVKSETPNRPETPNRQNEVEQPDLPVKSETPTKKISKKTRFIEALLRMNKKTYYFDDIKFAWWTLNPNNKNRMDYKKSNIICYHMNPKFAKYPNSGFGYLCRPSKSEPRYIKKLGKSKYIITDEPMKLIYN